MISRQPLPCLRFALWATLAVGMSVAMGGCAGGRVDACPYVRNENPSLLQGRTAAESPLNRAAERTDPATGVAAAF